MPILALWVVVAPFAAGAAIASSESLRKAVATHYVAALTLGWSALILGESVGPWTLLTALAVLASVAATQRAR